ncbi:MAG: DUF4863 family protein [Planctomycetes bacterium]|nr:DUF4863 family protein [Planctomycetota bacterium]
MEPDRLSAEGLRPLLEFASGLDLSDTEGAASALEMEFPFAGPFVQELGSALRAALADGVICDQGEAPMSWSRLFRPDESSSQFSADVVDMNGCGPCHTHPQGEIDLCFALEGEPRFDGNPEGWTVYGPDSTHVPTVEDGRMLILYLLPGGAFQFVK